MARLIGAFGIMGIMLIVLGSTTMVVVILLALWIGMFVVPYGSAMSQSIWMAKVEPDVQGKVFSVRSMVAQFTQPLALLVAGPIADGFFVPLMGGDSQLSDFFARFAGRGDQAGYAAFFVALGFATLAITVAAWSYGPVRHLERDMPDAEGLPEEADHDDLGSQQPPQLDAVDLPIGFDEGAVEPA
jgi:hypothetical protein